MNWAMKIMPIAEATAYQDAFEPLYVALGAPEDTGLLENSDASQAGVSTAIVIVAGDTSPFEALSPGGWRAIDPSGVKYWIGLVGRAETADRVGIKYGRQ